MTYERTQQGTSSTTAIAQANTFVVNQFGWLDTNNFMCIQIDK